MNFNSGSCCVLSHSFDRGSRVSPAGDSRDFLEADFDSRVFTAGRELQ